MEITEDFLITLCLQSSICPQTIINTSGGTTILPLEAAHKAICYREKVRQLSTLLYIYMYDPMIYIFINKSDFQKMTP